MNEPPGLVCPDCNATVAQGATACPSCGCPFETAESSDVEASEDEAASDEEDSETEPDDEEEDPNDKMRRMLTKIRDQAAQLLEFSDKGSQGTFDKTEKSFSLGGLFKTGKLLYQGHKCNKIVSLVDGAIVLLDGDGLTEEEFDACFMESINLLREVTQAFQKSGIELPEHLRLDD